MLAGRLERAWIPYLPDSRVLAFKSEAMWKGTLELMGPWHQLLARTPEDPSLN